MWRVLTTNRKRCICLGSNAVRWDGSQPSCLLLRCGNVRAKSIWCHCWLLTGFIFCFVFHFFNLIWMRYHMFSGTTKQSKSFACRNRRGKEKNSKAKNVCWYFKCQKHLAVKWIKIFIIFCSYCNWCDSKELDNLVAESEICVCVWGCHSDGWPFVLRNSLLHLGFHF